MGSYEFSPIPDGLASALDALRASADEAGWAVTSDQTVGGSLDELASLGMVRSVGHYINGQHGAFVTPKGMRYREELALWEAARDAADRSSARREWAIAVASAVIGATVSLLAARLGGMVNP